MMTLEDYAAEYERHAGEKFIRNETFPIRFSPEHGFCECKEEDGAMYIWQLCGDLHYWISMLYDECKKNGLRSMAAIIVRRPLPFIRRLGFKVVESEARQGRFFYKARNNAGEYLTATPFRDRYIFVWEVKQDAQKQKI